MPTAMRSPRTGTSRAAWMSQQVNDGKIGMEPKDASFIQPPGSFIEPEAAACTCLLNHQRD